MMNYTISKKIKTLRIEKGVRQEQIADLLHVSQSTYSRIENGRGKSSSWIKFAGKICNILEINPEEFFTSQVPGQNNQDDVSAGPNNAQHGITVKRLRVKKQR
ncbi:MAG: helix-turn-helix domain-containing protein [Prevotellaceae bacterium]|jgi:transcriptional regulator with XRE-family HTH domain|nr:helix-turn-helix domain-containing protein [Prevotellaceae bacterium]